VSWIVYKLFATFETVFYQQLKQSQIQTLFYYKWRL